MCLICLVFFLSELNPPEWLQVVDVSLTKEETERKGMLGLAQRGSRSPFSEVSTLRNILMSGITDTSAAIDAQRKSTTRIINISLIFN